MLWSSVPRRCTLCVPERGLRAPSPSCSPGIPALLLLPSQARPSLCRAGKPLQLQCSVLAMAFFSLGLHMARHELDVLWVAGSFLLVCMVDGVVAQGLLWSHFVDFFSLCSSYLHCKWATLEELEKDPRISQKIKRFRNKQAQMKHIFTEVRAECSAWPLPSPAQLGPVLWLSKPRQCPEHPGVTRGGTGRVTDVTCWVLPTLEVLLNGREGST